MVVFWCCAHLPGHHPAGFFGHLALQVAFKNGEIVDDAQAHDHDDLLWPGREEEALVMLVNIQKLFGDLSRLAFGFIADAHIDDLPLAHIRLD